MGLIDQMIKGVSSKKEDPNQLNTQEIQLVLSLLKLSTVKGEQVETFYNAVIKLQNQYLNLPQDQK